MPRDLDLDFDFQDEEVRERPVRPARPAQRRDTGGNRGGGRTKAPARRRKNDTTSIIILIVEIIVFIALIGVFFVLKSKIVDSDGSSKEAASAQESTTSNGVNVESPDFSLTCTKVQLVMDADNPDSRHLRRLMLLLRQPMLPLPNPTKMSRRLSACSLIQRTVL